MKKTIELTLFVLVTLLGALISLAGEFLMFPGWIVRAIGEWVVYFGGRFE